MARSARRASVRPSRPRRSKASEDRAEKGLRIGDAARIVGVKPFVLRFWETQFPSLKPRHAKSSHRLYNARDVENFKLIKRLLYQERFTIEGAKKHLKQFGLGQAAAAALGDRSSSRAQPPRAALDASTRETLIEIRRELESLHRLLEG